MENTFVISAGDPRDTGEVFLKEEPILNKRKLVSVRSIASVDPIEGADAIEVVTVDGWKVVTKKGDFKQGDPCVYFEIDSFLPDGVPAWQFLVDKSPKMFEGAKGHKLRTIKLRGQVSQGFVMPLSAFPEIMAKLMVPWVPVLNERMNLHVSADEAVNQAFAENFKKAVESIRDQDFSELLGIKKFEQPLPASLQGQAEGLFPSFIQKTDQERCQNLVREIFEYEPFIVPAEGDRPEFTRAPKGDPEALYEITMKLDGSSMTAFVRGEQNFGDDGTAPPILVPNVGVCSRNLQLKISDANKDNTFVRVLMDTCLNVALAAFFVRTGREIAVQGEVMAPGIQGNRENFNTTKFFVFDIYDIQAREYMNPVERMEVFELLKELAPTINHVPVMHTDVKLRELNLKSVQDLIAFAKGPSMVHKVREGVVFKRLDGKFSFKAINNDFLLKESD